MKRFIIKYLYTLSRAFWLLINPLSVGVRILLIRNSQIILVKHVYEDCWYLPGGLVERGESLEFAVRRESLEEVGAQIRNLALFGAYSNHHTGKRDHVIVFISKDFDISGKTDEEIEQWGFFDLHALPDNMSAGSSKRIQEYIDDQQRRYGDW